MARLEIGPGLEALKVAAEQAINARFAAATTPLAIYATKYIEARFVLEGGKSRLIEAEAALRGVSADEMAHLIDIAAKAAEAQELERIDLIQRVRAAETIPGLRIIARAANITIQA